MRCFYLRFLLLFGIVFPSINVSGQTVYKDTVPDIVFFVDNAGQTIQYLDINNDLLIDFKFIITGSMFSGLNTTLTPLNNAEIASVASFSVAKRNLDDTISPFIEWSDTVLRINQGSFSQAGPWYNDTNKFIGIRLIENIDTMYGWIRIDVINSGNSERIKIKDYAYNSISGQSIVAGECILPIAENIIISDVGDSRNGSDLKIYFEKAIDETKVEEYRIFVVKASETPLFTIDSALNVLAGNYIQVFPSGANFSDTLLPVSTDKDGNLIQNGISYNVFVLSITNAALLIPNVLSFPSNTLMLTSAPPTITNAIITPVYLGGTSYQINISFNKIADESLVDSYRVFFVKATLSASFTLSSANAVLPSNYYAIQPNGNNIQLELNSDTVRDYQAHSLVNSLEYRIFVLSVADGINATLNALTSQSAIFMLSAPALPVTDFVVRDTSDSGNASDLRILFSKVQPDSLVAGYRVFGVKLSDITPITPSLASSLLPDNYFFIPSTGFNVDTVLPVDAKDKDGDLILEDIPYRFYVLSVADSIHTETSALSKFSSIITLHTPDYYVAGLDTGIGVNYTNVDPDIVISNSSYNLDLNNDGIIDYLINKNYSPGAHITTGYSFIIPYNNNLVSVISPGLISPDTMKCFSMISQDIFWNDTNCVLYNFETAYLPPFNSYVYGLWRIINDRYIGLYLDEGFYGWVHLNCNMYSVTVLDYAWFDPSSGIYATEANPQLGIYPNPANNEIVIHTNAQNKQGVEMLICNSLGQVVYSVQCSQNMETIDVSSWANGIYFVKVQTYAWSKTEKFVVY